MRTIISVFFIALTKLAHYYQKEVVRQGARGRLSNGSYPVSVMSETEMFFKLAETSLSEQF